MRTVDPDDERKGSLRRPWRSLRSPGSHGWQGQPHDVQLFVPVAVPPTDVKLGGRSVPWSWNDGPLPGVVVRLHGPTMQGTITLDPK